MGRSLVAMLALVLGGCAAGVIDDQPANTGEEQPEPVKLPRAGKGNFGPETEMPSTTPANPDGAGPFFRVAYDEPTSAATLNSWSRNEAALQSDGTLTIATKKGYPGTDPQPADFHGGSFYNGGSFRFATVTSPVWTASTAFDTVTPSFEALTPPGTWIEVHVSAHVVATGEWTKDYSLGVWAHDSSTVRRHSVPGQKDAMGDVVTDRLELASLADAISVTVTLFAGDGTDVTTSPQLRAVSAITGLRATTPKPITAPNPSFWNKTLPVPKLSQMVYPDDSSSWSAPTSSSMLLGYWGVTATPPNAAQLSSDIVAGGPGNELFDTAFASAAANGGLHSIVTRLASFAQVEPLVAHGIPVAISLAYDTGELTGAPLSHASGHVIVVKGFDATGQVVVNDPAFASDETVETTYDRSQLSAAWLRAGGTTYVVWPEGKKLPVDPARAY